MTQNHVLNGGLESDNPGSRAALEGYDQGPEAGVARRKEQDSEGPEVSGPHEESLPPAAPRMVLPARVDTALPPVPARHEDQEPIPDETLAAVDRLVADGVPGSTERAYTFEWTRFVGWCSRSWRVPLPAEPGTVAAFVAWLESEETFLPDKTKRLKPASIERALAVISAVHRSKKFASPVDDDVVTAAMKGVKSRQPVRPVKKRAVKFEHFEAAVGKVFDSDLRGLRDKAVLLLGWAGGFRRSELVALGVSDLEKVGDRGYTVLIGKSKTDQAGEGYKKEIYKTGDATCPVAALDAWMVAAGVADRYVFPSLSSHGVLNQTRHMSDVTVARAVKRFVRDAVLRGVPLGDLIPDDVSGHSLRRGFVTDSIEAGIQDSVTMRQTGHRDFGTYSGYKEDAAPLTEKSGAVQLANALRKRRDEQK